MNEAVREMTYDEQIVNFIICILEIETPFGVKRDLISHLLSLSYRYDHDVKYANSEPTQYYGSNDSNALNALDALAEEGE